MPDITMKQFMRAVDTAVHYNVDVLEFVNGFRHALRIAELLELPLDEAEEIFYKAARTMRDA